MHHPETETRRQASVIHIDGHVEDFENNVE